MSYLYFDDDMRIPIEYDYCKECPKKVSEGLCRILIKTSFEKNSEYICTHLYAITKSKEVMVQGEKQRLKNLKFFQEQLDIAEALLVCKSTTESDYITINNAKGKAKLSASLVSMMENYLIGKFKENRLNFSEMTFEEAKDILENSVGGDIEEWVENYWNEYADCLGMSHEEKQMYMDSDAIDDELICEYAEQSQVEREITIELIKEKIKKIKERVKFYTKKGAPIKNTRLIAALCLFTSIKEKLNNQDYKTIYDCLDFFGLVTEPMKKSWADKKGYHEIQYIKSLHKACKKYNIQIIDTSNWDWLYDMAMNR
mgnify:CR=1 FL=1